MSTVSTSTTVSNSTTVSTARPRLRLPPRPTSALGSGRFVRVPSLRAAIVLYLAISAPICLVGLAATDVVTMEGIVADGARHMERSGDYSVPRLHGEIYTYKPPLAYWLALGSFRLFGQESEWALRLPFAGSALVMGLAVLLLTARIAGRRTGLLCAFASLTGALTLQKLHLAEFDVPLAAGVGVAVAVACRNLAVERPSGSLWAIAYLALAFAFLAKGIPALMFYAPGLLLAAAWTGRIRELLRPGHLLGALVFVLAVSLWLVSAYQAVGWEAFAQPLAEGRDKGLAWSATSVGATLVKPLKGWALFLPWTFLLPAASRVLRGSEPLRSLALAALSFVLAGVAIFMMVPATESRYLLPLAAPIGILCGLGARGAPPRLVRSLVAVAILFWLFHSLVVEPRRAEARSLRSVAAAFEEHMTPDAVLWAGPVSKHFRHSSLSYYLNRPIVTFVAHDGVGPRVGDYLVFFSDEHAELMAALPFDVEVVERQSRRREEFVLARVLVARGD